MTMFSMRKALFAALGLCLAGSMVMAQEKPKAKPVSGTIMLSSEVKVGDKVLRPGEYKVTSNGETIVFSESANRDRDPVKVTLPAKGKDLSAPSTRTEVNTTTDASGATVLQSVLLKGSPMEFTFDNLPRPSNAK